MIGSRCGCPCDTCEFHLDGRCAGCIALSGVPFHDTKVCRLADCCQRRGYLHCGQCPDFPCGELIQFSNDEQYGDNPPGERIERLREWAKDAPGVGVGKCGTECSTCGFREKRNCAGCGAQQGEVFWGSCDVAKCAAGRGYRHCGQCPELPCEMLADMIENGHNPDRLDNLKR